MDICEFWQTFTVHSSGAPIQNLQDNVCIQIIFHILNLILFPTTARDNTYGIICLKRIQHLYDVRMMQVLLNFTFLSKARYFPLLSSSLKKFNKVQITLRYLQICTCKCELDFGQYSPQTLIVYF